MLFPLRKSSKEVSYHVGLLAKRVWFWNYYTSGCALDLSCFEGHWGTACGCERSFLTCDICGRRLISFRLMVWGRRLLSRWQRRTPSRSVCAKSNTCADSHVTRWLAGSTLQLINHSAHCLQYSIIILTSASFREYVVWFGFSLEWKCWRLGSASQTQSILCPPTKTRLKRNWTSA